MVKKAFMKRSSKDLVPKTLNYHDWKLEILLASGGVGGALLNALLHNAKCSCSQCQMINFTLISFHIHIHQVLNALPIEFGFTEYP